MFNSIRTKLTLVYTVILAAAMIAIAASVYYAIMRSVDRDLDERLNEMSDSFIAALRAEQADSKDDPDSDPVRETTAEMRFRDYQFIVYSPEGKLRATTADVDVPFVGGEESGHFAEIHLQGKAFKTFRTRVSLGTEKVDLYVIHSLDEIAAMESDLARIFFVGFPLTLIFASLCGYLLARRTLAPMVEMGRHAGRISDRNLEERLILKNPRDELGQLGTFFNDLLSRLDAAFRQQRRFMADASHEFRTPLAIIRGESEVTLLKGDRTIDEYRESLSVVHDESKRLTNIVDDLFTLARADAGQFKPTFAPVYLDEIVNESVRAISVLARKKNISVEVVSGGEMPMKADEALLHRLFLNLLDNAVKYGCENGSVKVRCETKADLYLVEIEDKGPGISDAEKDRIFERFYRVDKARSRDDRGKTSGAGLGLAIAQWIAEIHSGKISLVSSSDEGSIFGVVFRRSNHS